MATADEKKIVNFWGKASSPVWESFGFYQNTSSKVVDKTKTVCKICMKTYAYNGNTTNLANHLKREHSEHPAPSTVKKDQPTIDQSLAHPLHPLPLKRKNEIDMAITAFIVNSLSPLTMVEKPHFRNLLKVLEPRYTPPTTKTLKTRIDEAHKVGKESIQEEIKTVQNVSITHDSWTSIATDNYETVTCHYIKTDDHGGPWELKSKVLQTTKIEGPHNAENIASFLTEVKDTWKLPDIMAVTDNASVEVKAFRDLNWERLGCLGHTINLVVKAAVKEKSSNRLIAKGRNLVTYFHKSPLATGYLNDKQKLLGKDDNKRSYKLISDVQTRWNSTLEMLERLLELTPAIHAVYSDPEIKLKDLRSMLYNYDEQQQVEGLITILTPFKCATEVLSGEKSPTLSLVIPTLTKLLRSLKTEAENNNPENPDEMAAETKVLRSMKKAMESDLKQRLGPHLPTYQLASALDPRTKAMILKDIGTERIKTELYDAVQSLDMNTQVDEAMDIPNDDVSSPNDEATDTQSKKLKSDNWLADVLTENNTNTNSMPSVLQEVERYLADPYLKDDTVMAWWGIRASSYPRISVLAKTLLATPASSVPSERIFSLAGNIVSKKRACLKPDTVDSLIFLKHNGDW